MVSTHCCLLISSVCQWRLVQSDLTQFALRATPFFYPFRITIFLKYAHLSTDFRSFTWFCVSSKGVSGVKGAGLTVRRKLLQFKCCDSVLTDLLFPAINWINQYHKRDFLYSSLNEFLFITIASRERLCFVRPLRWNAFDSFIFENVAWFITNFILYLYFQVSHSGNVAMDYVGNSQKIPSMLQCSPSRFFPK